ncbi:MAG TPA: IPT/TIG domain-containing protein, partial [Candidatus Sulfopaludibacter sp.]|nr:IPT/TIG domain-containing protein [Candidatus Sulfopaludibacter sp.]
MMRPTAWLLLLAAFGARVEAQTQMTCAASAVQKNVRSEGDTELVADVVLRCTGGVPTVNGGAIPPATFTLAFNANVTSRILGGTSASEALLLLDEPAPGQQFPCDQASGVCPGYGNGNGSGYYGGGVQAPKTPNNRNVFQGYVGAIGVAAGGGNVLTWSNIPIDSPGSGTRVYRFTNIRLNVSSLAGKLPQLTGISLSGQIGSVPIAPTSLTLGTTLTSLSTSVRDAGDANSAPNGVTVPLALGGANTVRYATLRFAGQYQSAARPRTTAPFINADSSPPPTTPQNNPGTVYDSESGFYNPSFGTYAGGNLGLAGLADSGPRFMAVFSNIPAGFTISVDLYNSTSASGPTARLVNTASNGSGPFSPASGNGTVATLAPVNGSVTAVWEVLRDTTQASDQYDFGVYLTYGSGAAVPPPIAVQMEYAPFLANSAPSIPLFNGVASGQTLMTFTSAPILAVTPASLAFTGTAGGPSPAPQALGINATSPVSFSVASGGVLPLNIQPASGITPQSVFVSLNTQGMAAGTYKDTITVQSQAALPVQVPVTLTLNPAPAITSISPQSALAGGPGFTLTVNGANFSNPATVIWNNTALPTSFAGSTQLTAQVAASLIATPGTATIVVVLSDGSTSNSVNFTISSLTITAINPSSVVAGSAAFTLTITGSGFAQGDSVTVGSA